MKKRLMLVMGLAVAALGIGATAAVLGTTPAVFTRATGETRSIVLTAADFAPGAGNFNKSGMEFHYDEASVNGNVVTLTKGRVYMTTAHYSGDSVSDGGLMGNGFTTLTITDLNKTGDGSVVYAKQDVEGPVTGFEVASSIDLTKGGTLASSERVRVMVECGNATISFSKMTFTYECVEAQPVIEISGDTHVDKDDSITLTATTERVDASATYNWISSNTNLATVVGNGKSATVTGVAAGDVTITVQAIVDEVVVATDTFDLTVLSTDMPTEELPVIVSGNEGRLTKVEGASIWVYLDNSTLEISGVNAESIIADIGISSSSPKGEAAPYVDGGSNAMAYKSHRFDDYGTNTVRLYIDLNVGVPTTWDVTLVATIKLVISGTQYVNTISFFNGEYQHA